MQQLHHSLIALPERLTPPDTIDVARTPNVETALDSEVRELLGDRTLEAVVVEEQKTGEQGVSRRGPCSCSSVRSYTPTGSAASWHSTRRATSGPAWSIGQTLHRVPRTLETVRPGVFAVGDARSGSIKRVASAVGKGAWRSVWSTSISRTWEERSAGDRGTALLTSSGDGGD
jgi:thioredoxin reductase